jgi:hypothetical protein
LTYFRRTVGHKGDSGPPERADHGAARVVGHMQVPKNLQSALPFKSKPKDERKKEGKTLKQKVLPSLHTLSTYWHVEVLTPIGYAFLIN